MVIEPAQLRDALPIAHASRRYIEQGLAWRWRLPSIVRALQQNNVEVAVARELNELAAFGLLELFERQAHLLLFAVLPAHRRAGTGSRLMHYFEELCLTAGVFDLRLEMRAPNIAALRFYQHLGYEILGRRPGYYQGKEDALLLQKRWPQSKANTRDDLSQLLKLATPNGRS